MASDFQRQKLYDFEDIFFFYNSRFRVYRLSKANCEAAAKAIVKEFDLNYAVTVTFHADSTATCTVNHDTHAANINLPVGHRNFQTIVHEMTHIMTPFHKHDGVFAAQYLYLTSLYSDVSYQALKNKATAFGLRVGPDHAIRRRVRRTKFLQLQAVA
jgi:hypothetical protein